MTTQLDKELRTLLAKMQIWDGIDLILVYLQVSMVGGLLMMLILHLFGYLDGASKPFLISVWLFAVAIATRKHYTVAKLRNAKLAIVDFFKKNPDYVLPEKK